MKITSKPFFFLSIITFVALLLCILSAWSLYKSEEMNITRKFKADADERIALIYRELLINLEAQRSLEMLYSGDLPTIARFEAESQRILARYQDLLVLEWIPQSMLAVNSKQNTANLSVNNADNNLLNTMVTRYSDALRMDIMEVEKQHYFPLYFFPQDDKNKRQKDAYQARLSLLQKSINTGLPQLTNRIDLSQHGETESGILALLPIYNPTANQKINSVDQVKNRQENILGFIMGIYKIRDLVESSEMNDNTLNMEMKLFDITDVEGGKTDSLMPLYTHSFKGLEQAEAEASELQSNDSNQYRESIIHEKILPIVWGRTWVSYVTQTDEYLQGKRSYVPYIILFVGFILIVFFIWYLRFNAVRTAMITRIVKQKTTALSEANEQLKQLSRSDCLTKLANRRTMDEVLNREWLRAMRSGAPLSFILIDIDYFKQYNDNYGHVMGDACLQKVATALQVIPRRASDLIARYGGEEFAIILAETENAQQVAEKCRSQIEALQITHGFSDISDVITISVGVCTGVPQRGSEPYSFIDEADKALYRAKHAGRNRVSSACEKKLNYA